MRWHRDTDALDWAILGPKVRVQDLVGCVAHGATRAALLLCVMELGAGQIPIECVEAALPRQARLFVQTLIELMIIRLVFE